MKQVQNGASNKGALDELHRRNEHRTEAFDRSPEFAEQRMRELASRSLASKTYKVSSVEFSELQKYKNGVSGKGAYMTEHDFANRYRAKRQYIPEAKVEIDSIMVLNKIEEDRYKKTKARPKRQAESKKTQIPSNKAKSTAPGVKNEKGANRKMPMPKANAKPNSKSENPSKFKEAAREAAKTWIPLEERHREKVVQGTPTKLPKDVIFAILVIAVSLLLIVGSAVLLGSAKREQSELENMISKLDSQISELEDELERKNAYADIEIYANEHGMISKEHISVEYINSNKTDSVESTNSDSFSLSTLIKWFFGNLK